MVATTPGDSAAWLDRVRRAALVAALIIFAALVVAFVRTIVGDWHATGDQALIELRSFDVGGRHTPLIGPYSRYGWSHPGPALFYALAPVLRIFGGHDTGLLAGALAINALALAAMFAVVWRRRDTAAFVLVLLVATILVRAPGAVALFEPWNPYIIVLPLLAAAVCAWSAMRGSRWSLVATVALASFVTQSHIGAALPAAAITFVALLWLGVDARRSAGDNRRRYVGSILRAFLAGFIVWLPPLVQAATSSGGNLREIWDFWTASHPVTGFAHGARLVSPQFAVPAPWMGAHERALLDGALLPSTNRFPVALLLLAVVTVIAIRRRDRDAVALCSLAWAFAVATFIAASRIVETPFPYVLRWAWVAGALVWLAVGYAGSRALPARVASARVAVLAAAVMATCVLGVFVVASAARTPLPVPVESHTLAEIRGPALAAMRRAPEPIFVETGASLPVANVAAGLFLDASRAGLSVRVPVSVGYRYGSFRAVHGRPGSTLLVTNDPGADPRLRAGGGYHLIASYDALDPSDRQTLDRLLGRVKGDFQALVDLERDHPRDYARLQSLKARDVSVAVFLGTG